MMNLIGKWSIAQMMHFDEEKGLVWTDAAEILAKEADDKEMQMMVKTEVLIEEDGSMTFLSPLPEGVSQEEIDEAVAAGELTLRDGKMIVGQNHWKVEDGKLMADTGLEGEILDEKVGPWEEIKEVEDGMIQFAFYHLKRME